MADAFNPCYVQAYVPWERVHWSISLLQHTLLILVNVQGRVNGPWSENPKQLRRMEGDLEKCLCPSSTRISQLHAVLVMICIFQR